MDLVKTIETPYNNAVALINKANDILSENNVKDSTGLEIAQFETNQANPAWLFALACGSLHSSWQRKLAKAYSCLDPASCEDDQVLVLASLAGMERGNGTPSHVTARLTNASQDSVTVPMGAGFSETISGHVWFLDREITLSPTGQEGDGATVALYTEEDGAFSVPAGTSFSPESDEDPNPFASITCESLYDSFEGETIESISSLRNRLTQGVEQTDFILQAMNAIEKLPGIESCTIWFNGSITGDLPIGPSPKTVLVPPRSCYISIKGVDITGGIAKTYYSNMDIPASVGEHSSTCRLGMQDLEVKYDSASEIVVNVYIDIRASDAASGADGAYKEAVMAKSGSLAAGENLTAQMVSDWVRNVGYATVIGCRVGSPTSSITNIAANEYIVFSEDAIQVSKIGA